MNARDTPEVKAIMDEWIKEVEKLKPIDVSSNVLDNSLNKKRYELEQKYRKLIDEAIKKHSSENQCAFLMHERGMI